LVHDFLREQTRRQERGAVLMHSAQQGLPGVIDKGYTPQIDRDRPGWMSGPRISPTFVKLCHPAFRQPPANVEGDRAKAFFHLSLHHRMLIKGQSILRLLLYYFLKFRRAMQD
jgi:hypothetical protein